MQGALAFAAPVFRLCILLDPRSTVYPGRAGTPKCFQSGPFI